MPTFDSTFIAPLRWLSPSYFNAFATALVGPDAPLLNTAYLCYLLFLVAFVALALVALAYLLLVFLVPYLGAAHCVARFNPWLDSYLPGRQISLGPGARFWKEQASSTEIPVVRPHPSNPHWLAAQLRSECRGFMLSVARASNLPLYAVSMSNKDLKDGLDGDRLDFDVKDAVSYTFTKPRRDGETLGPHARLYMDVADQMPERDIVRDFQDENAAICIAGQQFRDVAGLDANVPFRYVPETKTWCYAVPNSGYDHAQWLWQGESLTTWSWWFVNKWRQSAMIAIAVAMLYFTYFTTYTPDQHDIFGWCFKMNPWFEFPIARALWNFADNAEVSSLARIVGLRWFKVQYPESVPCWDYDYYGCAAVFVITYLITIPYWIRAKTVCRKLERFDISTHRSVVFLPPTRVYGTVRTLLTAWMIRDAPKRLEPETIQGGSIIAMRILDNERTYLSIALKDSFVSYRANEALQACLRVAVAGTKTIPGASQLITLAKAIKPEPVTDLSSTWAGVLAQWYASKEVGSEARRAPHTSFLPRTIEPMRVYTKDEAPLEEGKTGMRTLMPPPISGDCYVPPKNRENELNTNRVRIEAMRNEAEMTPEISDCMDEFVQLLAGDMCGPDDVRLHIADEQEVRDRQTRPTQRHILDEGQNTYTGEFDPLCKAFQKAEPYSSANSPRRITTCPPELKWRGSRVEYAMGKYLKNTKWYAFGRNLQQVGELLVNTYVGAQWSADGDYTNMDGSVGKIERELDRRVRARVFDPVDLPFVMETCELMYNNPVKCTFGTRYEQLESQASGFGDTSTSNTIRNAFVAFLSWRLAGKDAETAYEKLGVYGGDDGATPDGSVEHLLQAATMVGKVLKISTVPHGEPISFLGRYYGEIWAGGDNSCCDIPRQFKKWHVTTQPDTVPDHIVLAEKGHSFLITDANTPIIGVLAKKCAALAPRTTVSRTAQDLLDAGAVVTNETADWMHTLYSSWLDTHQVDAFLRWAESDAPISECPTVHFNDVVVKAGSGPAIIDGVTYPDPSPVEAPLARGRATTSDSESKSSQASTGRAAKEPRPRRSDAEHKAWLQTPAGQLSKRYHQEEHRLMKNAKLNPKLGSDLNAFRTSPEGREFRNAWNVAHAVPQSTPV